MQLSEGTAQRLVDQLDRAQDIASEAQILRKIKNDVTGHELRKIAYIRAGLVPALSDLLSARSTPTATDDVSFRTSHPNEEAVWWHTSSIVMVLANAGTAYTHALVDGSLLTLLIDRLRITDPSERLALSLICCLNAIADNLPLECDEAWEADQSLARALYTAETAACLTRIAAISPDSSQSRQRLDAVLTLICRTCHSEAHICLLLGSGLLDVLCGHLAACISLHGRHLPNFPRDHSPQQDSRLPATALILEALALIIEASEHRTQQFASHDAIERALLVAMGTHTTISQLAPTGVLPTQIDFDHQQLMYDFPLPAIPDLHSMYLAKKSTWPPLSQSTETPTTPRRQGQSSTHDTVRVPRGDTWSDVSGEQLRTHAIVPWLLYLVRSARGRTRIMAAHLLVILKSYRMLNGKTMRSLSTLLVPILVAMLESQPHPACQMSSYVERVPAILALLVRDHEYLQQAAVEAQAIPKLTSALKANFENTRDLSAELWWPSKLWDKLTIGVRDRSLGLGGPSRYMRVQMILREGLLQALAALAPDSDVFRKDICDQGALNHIILALEPFHVRTVPGQHCDRIVVAGNSSEALIAACGAVRALTRSPTSLRTKIVDADVAKHIIKLLYTPEPAVRVAATMVVANLSHGFSPMKSSIAETAVIKKLCEQAHSVNAQLRRETLFALKAFIYLSSNKVKRMVVDELGVDWIRYLIAIDPHDVPAGEVMGLAESDHRKSSVVRIPDDADMPDADSSHAEPANDDYSRHTLEQDLEIQAELLGFLRNLTTGESPLEIIDHVMDNIGFDDFLQIVVDRLKASASSYSRLVGKIVQNCIYIVAHLAVADAKYRSSIAHNLVLMKQVNTFLGHSDPLIRRACCWLVIGVIYSTTESQAAAVSRAKDLQRLGLVANLWRMKQTDLDTDVKERASTACDVFNKLLDKT